MKTKFNYGLPLMIILIIIGVFIVGKFAVKSFDSDKKGRDYLTEQGY